MDVKSGIKRGRERKVGKRGIRREKIRWKKSCI